MTLELNVGTVEVDIDGTKFVVRPFTIFDQARAAEFAKQTDRNESSDVLAGLYLLAQRIVSWDVIDSKTGAKVPCTPDNVAIFFGQYPELIVKITDQIRDVEVEEEKNSEPSQPT